MLQMIRRFFGRRGFKATRLDRSNSDWVTSPIKTNEDIKTSLEVLMTRSRDLSKNNSDYRKWLSMRSKNIVGENGIKVNFKSRNDTGELDKVANYILHKEFDAWGKLSVGAVSVDGLHSWRTFIDLVDRTFAIDGEAFIRIVPRQNRWGISLQLIDSMLLDVGYNVKPSKYSNEIVMGVERDDDGRPVKYHFRRDVDYYGRTVDRVALPAEQIIHYYKIEFAGQARGFPTACAAILDMNMLNGYMEAELVAARTAACQMAVWEVPENGSGKLTFDEPETEKYTVDMEPGKFAVGPRGWKLNTLLPVHPGQNVGGFIKSVLRRVAGGLSVSYNDFANDLEGVNFSSLRAGTLSERDGWKISQSDIGDQVCERVVTAWLEMVLLRGITPLPLGKFDKFNNYQFRFRRWDWVDPLKDIKAHEAAIQLGIVAPQDIIEARGDDPEEIAEKIREWKKLTASEVENEQAE